MPVAPAAPAAPGMPVAPAPLQEAAPTPSPVQEATSTPAPAPVQEDAPAPAPAPAQAVSGTGNPAIDELIATGIKGMKPKDKKEYIAKMESTAEAWMQYASAVGLDPALKEGAEKVINALRERVAEVSAPTRRSTSRASNPVDATDAQTPSAGASKPVDTTDAQTPSVGASNATEAETALMCAHGHFSNSEITSAEEAMAAIHAYSALVYYRLHMHKPM